MLEMLKKRRSIRVYKKKKVEEDKIQQLIKAALLSPSGKNILPWEFIVVTDEDILKKLSQAKPYGATFLKDAPLGIVVLGDEKESDVWIEDASIASIIIQLTAQSIGLGSCWIQIRKRQHNLEETAEEYIGKTLELPKTKRVEAIIALGYPDEEKKPHSEESLRFDKVYINKYKV